MHPNQYLKQYADSRPRTHRIEVNDKVKEIYAETDGHAEVLARNSVIGEVYQIKVKKIMDPLDFTRQYNNISPITLEEILETLEDNGYLSATGEQFRHKYWEMFIKE